MSEMNEYQMAIDLLRCHLGITEDQARQQLGLSAKVNLSSLVEESHIALLKAKSNQTTNNLFVTK
jgi:hypothetical protein